MSTQRETTASRIRSKLNGNRARAVASEEILKDQQAEEDRQDTPDLDIGRETGTGAEPGSEGHRENLYEQIRRELEGKSLHEEEIQYELARWVELLETSEQDVGDGKGEDEQSKKAFVARLVRKAGAAIPALFSDKPELVFARTLRIRAEMQLLHRNGLPSRMLVGATDGSPTLLVGLGTLFAVAIGLFVHLLWPWLRDVPYVAGLMPLDMTHAPMVAGAAFLGGAVSILTRLQAFSRLRDFDPMFLFLNALAKPFLGLVFGLFAYAAVNSGLLPLEQASVEAAGAYHWWTLGFLAGFSERFANDLVSRGEGLASPKKP